MTCDVLLLLHNALQQPHIRLLQARARRRNRRSQSPPPPLKQTTPTPETNHFSNHKPRPVHASLSHRRPSHGPHETPQGHVQIPLIFPHRACGCLRHIQVRPRDSLPFLCSVYQSFAVQIGVARRCEGCVRLLRSKGGLQTRDCFRVFCASRGIFCPEPTFRYIFCFFCCHGCGGPP